MEDPVGGTTVPDDHQHSGYSVVFRNRGPKAAGATSGGGRRNSFADFGDLRRRDIASNYVAGAQFKGLVIPSPAAGGSGDTSSSTCFLPTIAGTKPQSKLLLTSSTQERRGSSGYQSVLTGLPFISTSRSNATTGAQRRSSVYGYPFLQHSSGSSVCTSLIEPPGRSECVNNVFAGRDEQDASLHTEEFDKPKSTGPLASTDCTGASDEVSPGTPSHGQDKGPADDRLVSYDDLDNDTNSSSTRCTAASTATECDVSPDTSNAESPRVDDVKPDKQCEERRDDVVDMEELTHSCRSAEPQVDRCDLPTSTFDALTTSELTIPDECRPESLDSESLDHSVVSPIMALQMQLKSPVGSPADCTETMADSGQDKAAATAADVDCGDRESASSTSPELERSQVDVKFNGDVNNTETESMALSGNDNLMNVVINKGNLGLGFCISGGRASTTGDRPVVIKRIFKGSLRYIVGACVYTCSRTTAELADE